LKRFQNRNFVVRLILRLWYILIPFYALFLYYKNNDEKFKCNFRLCWSLAVAEVQIKMNWLYDSEEVFENVFVKINKINNKKMNLTNLILSKDGKTIELQGMIHICEPEFYKIQQNKIDQLKETIVFYEGVKKKNENKSFTESQEKIKEFFLLLFEIFPLVAKGNGLIFQKDAIKYPNESINADISFEDLILKLDEKKFNPTSSIKIFEAIKDDTETIEKIQKFLLKYLKNKKFGFISKIIIKIMSYSKFSSIVLHHRNNVAVEIILSEMEKNNFKKAFVHYGEAHIFGIKKILKERGWKIVK
jgi:hypothetical protein